MKAVKYRNDTAEDITAPGLRTLAPGEEITTPDVKYLVHPIGLTLTQDRDAPWIKLHAGNLPVGIESGLAKYGQIQIVNNSGALVNVVVNNDAVNPKVILSEKTEFITQDREIDSMIVTGEGTTGGVYVYGMF